MFLNSNYIDLIIIIVLIFFASEAWRHGFWVILVDFISFLGSLIISLRVYKYGALLLRSSFNLSHSISNALGFLATAVVSEFVLNCLLGFYLKKLPQKFFKSKLSKLLGILPALGEGIILIAFFLTLILAFPISPSIKKNVADSKIGGSFLTKTSRLEKKINEIFGGVIEDSLTYLTIKPDSRETISLKIENKGLSIDEASEAEMFKLINEERKKAGTKELEWSPDLVIVARAHARDMWERKYFSHISPEGKDVGDRLAVAKIEYRMAGENLALPPTVSTAHTGLMNSQGHRENIFETGFSKIGIGVINNGIYGKMFVQIFTN